MWRSPRAAAASSGSTATKCASSRAASRRCGMAPMRATAARNVPPGRVLQGMMMSKPSPVALIVGAGDATGGAIARRFARGGYTVCATRRSLDKLQPLLDQIKAEGRTAHGIASDARKEEEV